MKEHIEKGIDGAYQLGHDKGYIDGIREAIDVLYQFGLEEHEKELRVKILMKEAVINFQNKWGK